MDTFKFFKQEMIDRGLQENSCDEGLIDFESSLNIEDLSDAIKKHFHFAITNNILTVQLFAVMKQQLNAHGIYCNQDCNDGYVFVTDDSKISITGASKAMCFDTSNVCAYGDSVVQAYNNSIVKAFDRTLVVVCDNTLVHSYDESKVNARGKSVVHAYHCSQIKLNGYAHATMNDSSRAFVNGDATITNQSVAKHVLIKNK